MDKLLAQPADLCKISIGVFKEAALEETATLLSVEGVETTSENLADLQKVFDYYWGLFEVPKGQPPPRSHDHRITLKDGSSPVNIRPHRFPVIQNDEIEKMVEELLYSGVIRHNTSPYSSPIVMVKKKDGT